MFDEASRLVVADRCDELAALYSPDVVLEDRRAGMGHRVEGAAANIEHLRTIRSLGLSGIDSHVVAVRGDRLALIASQWHADYDVDLLGIACVDSNGLGELVQSLKVSGRHGASLRLLKPQDRVKKTLKLTNLLPMFTVYDTEADALKAFEN